MVNVRMIGEKRFRRRILAAIPRTPQNMKRRLKQSARVTQREIRAQFGPRVTDQRTRKRRTGGNRLGTFTGRAERNIRTRIVFKNRKEFAAYIGPPGEIGTRRWQSGRAWYLRFHEMGIAGMPRRSTIRAGERKAAPRVRRLMRRTAEIFR